MQQRGRRSRHHLRAGLRRHRRGQPRIPQRAVGQAEQQRAIGRDHGVDDAVGEQVRGHVPVAEELAVLLRDLVVDQHLRRRGDVVDRRPQPVPAARLRLGDRPLAAEAEGRGEHDRHGGRGLAGPAGDLAQHVAAAHLRMFQIGGELPRQRPGAVGEGRCGRVDLQQDGGGVVAQHQRHVGMQRRPVERRHGQAEALRAAPGGERVGVGAREQRGQRDTMCLGLAAQRGGGVGGQHDIVAAEARADPIRGIRPQRQVGAGRQGGGTLRPIRRAALPRSGLLRGELGQHDVAEAHADRWQRGGKVVVQHAPFPAQRMDAGGVERDQVEAHVQPRLAVEASDADVEQRPRIRRGNAARQLRPQARELRSGIGAGQVEDGEPAFRHLRQDLLRAVGADHRAQHVVTADQDVPRRLGAGEVDLVGVELGVEVAAHAAEGQVAAPSHPVGALHVGERERVVPMREIGCEHRRRAGAGGLPERGGRPRGDRRCSRRGCGRVQAGRSRVQRGCGRCRRGLCGRVRCGVLRRGRGCARQGTERGALDQLAHRQRQAQLAFRAVADLDRHQRVEAQIVQRHIRIRGGRQTEACRHDHPQHRHLPVRIAGHLRSMEGHGGGR